MLLVVRIEGYAEPTVVATCVLAGSTASKGARSVLMAATHQENESSGRIPDVVSVSIGLSRSPPHMAWRRGEESVISAAAPQKIRPYAVRLVESVRRANGRMMIKRVIDPKLCLDLTKAESPDEPALQPRLDHCSLRSGTPATRLLRGRRPQAGSVPDGALTLSCLNRLRRPATGSRSADDLIGRAAPAKKGASASCVRHSHAERRASESLP
jgi:hypothetical protein